MTRQVMPGCGVGIRCRLILLVCRQYRSRVGLLAAVCQSECILPVKRSMNKACYESPTPMSRPQAGITSIPRNRLHTKRTPRRRGSSLQARNLNYSLRGRGKYQPILSNPFKIRQEFLEFDLKVGLFAGPDLGHLSHHRRRIGLGCD